MKIAKCNKPEICFAYIGECKPLLKGTTIVMLSLDGKVGENLIPRTKFNITMKTINPEVKIVPQNCYVSSSPNPNYPFKHYIIRDRLPLEKNYLQHQLTSRIFSASVPSTLFKNLKKPLYTHCQSLVCPRLSNACRCRFTCPSRRLAAFGDEPENDEAEIDEEKEDMEEYPTIRTESRVKFVN